jgi:hypothetical protein
MACQGMHRAQYCIGSTAAPLQNKYRGQKAAFLLSCVMRLRLFACAICICV